jgi:hypothetical protein
LAASFASLSTASFPFDPWCPATHAKAISILGWLLMLYACCLAISLWCRVARFHLILSMRYWADCGRLLIMVFIIAWLSMLNVIFGCVSTMSWARCIPKIMATSSPSKTVCCVFGPSW